MKLSEKTLAVLKSYTKINESILFSPGNVLKTISPGKNMFSEVTVDEEFEQEAAIYNLTELLNSLSLFKDADIQFKDNHVLISGDRGKLKYFYADKSVIVYPDKALKLPTFDFDFKLSKTDLASVLEAARVLSLPNVSLVSDKKKLILRAHDSSNASSNKFDVNVGSLEKDVGEFELTFKLENLHLLDLDYQVSIAFRGIALFQNTDFDIKYAIGLVPTKVPGK